MKTSAIICTYNRCDCVERAIRSLAEQSCSRNEYEVIVVDNNSTDNTKTVVKALIPSFSNLRYIHEKKQGLSYARNRGIKEAEGKIVAFTDDDIEADNDWIKELFMIFEKYRDVSCVGGKSIPIFEGGRPRWLSDGLLEHYGDTGFGRKPMYLKLPDFPFGLNMAFRKKCFEQLGVFNHALGRNKSCLLADEDKEFFYRIGKTQLRTFYTPYAVIRHIVPSTRTTRKWLLKRAYWQGISHVVCEDIIHSDSELLPIQKARREARLLTKTLCRQIIRYKTIDLQFLIFFLSRCGQIRQYFHLALRPVKT